MKRRPFLARLRTRALLQVLDSLRLVPRPLLRPTLCCAAVLARRTQAARLCRQQLALVAPHLGWDQAQQSAILSGVTRHAARQVEVVLRLARGGAGIWIDEAVRLTSGQEHYAALQASKRALLLTGHIGHWELLAAWARRRNQMEAVIGRSGLQGAFLARVRARHGLLTLGQEQSARQTLALLMQKGRLGLLADLETRQLDGEFLPFLGVPALTMTAPAALSRASQAEVFMAHLVDEGDHFALSIEPPLPPPARAASLLPLLQEINATYARWILAHPGQWAWHQPRWRTRPGEWDAQPNPALRRAKHSREL